MNPLGCYFISEGAWPRNMESHQQWSGSFPGYRWGPYSDLLLQPLSNTDTDTDRLWLCFGLWIDHVGQWHCWALLGNTHCSNISLRAPHTAVKLIYSVLWTKCHTDWAEVSALLKDMFVLLQRELGHHCPVISKDCSVQNAIYSINAKLQTKCAMSNYKLGGSSPEC